MLKAHSEWLLRLQVSFAIQLQVTLAKFVLPNVVIIMAVNGIKSFLVLCYLTVLVHTKTYFHLSVWLVVEQLV